MISEMIGWIIMIGIIIPWAISTTFSAIEMLVNGIVYLYKKATGCSAYTGSGPSQDQTAS